MRSWDRLNLLIVLLTLLLEAIDVMVPLLRELLIMLVLVLVPLLLLVVLMARILLEMSLVDLMGLASWNFLLTCGLLGLALTELAIVKLAGLR